MVKVPSFFKNKIFLGIILFILVFSIFAFCVDDIWFQLDDLGNIISGLIKNVKDFLKVFSEDERNYIYPINFNVPQANIISGFYRPMQHIPFTITYFLRGFDAYSFYIVNVLFHALNTVLFFLLLSFVVPRSLSFFGGLLFGFYPLYNWITWISTLHNFLAVFFMLLSLIFYKFYFFDKELNLKKNLYHFLSGLMFFFSVISRENTIFFGIWIFFALFIYSPEFSGIWNRFRYALKHSYVFFVFYLIYFLLRLYFFGLSSLLRTLNNVLLRVPFLSNIFGVAVSETTGVAAVNIKTNLVTAVLKTNQVSEKSFSALNLIIQKVSRVWLFIERWLTEIFNLNPNSLHEKLFFLIIVVFIFSFILFAFKKHFKILFILLLGFLLFSWPGVVAYPNARYINAVYPFVIFIFILAIYFFRKNYQSKFAKVLCYIVLTISFLGTVKSTLKNIKLIKSNCVNTLKYKEKFAQFFQENNFDKNANFIVVGSPFVSDIQNVFQAFLNNLDLKLANVRASSLAQKGSMGCGGDYRSKEVKSKIQKINQEGKVGFRLTSLDKDHCAWWMHFSHFPLKWSHEEKAYIWTKEEPQVGEWYDYSMGQFLIHEKYNDKYITDVTFLFDDKWIDKDTVFVYWDTLVGKYKVY